jgi:hypothetical protein
LTSTEPSWWDVFRTETSNVAAGPRQKLTLAITHLYPPGGNLKVGEGLSHASP